MDAERLALQARPAGEIDMSAGADSARRISAASTAVRDLQRDWRLWSAAERFCAIAFCGLWGIGIVTTIFAHSDMVSPPTIVRLSAPPSDGVLQVASAAGNGATACCVNPATRLAYVAQRAPAPTPPRF